MYVKVVQIEHRYDPFLMGAKCIDYDANYAELAGVNMSQVGKQAQHLMVLSWRLMLVRTLTRQSLTSGDYYFAIVCGCLEGAWENTVFWRESPLHCTYGNDCKVAIYRK